MDDQDIEIWKSIPGFPGYEVSNHGQVRSYYSHTGSNRGWIITNTPQRILKPYRESYGYKYVNLRNGSQHTHRIHAIVMLAFVGPCPDNLEVCHNDNDPSNNNLSNLRYDTHEANLGDRPDILSREVIETMRQQAANGETVDNLVLMYGLGINAIYRIILGRTHKLAGGPRQTPYTNGQLRRCQRAEQIREERIAGMSLAELAERYRLSKSAISLICAGKRTRSSLDRSGDPSMLDRQGR